MTKISVIIPIYNTDKYLRRCIDSIINQDFKDYEIILIDDGSSDNSALICDEYAQKYSNIIVVHTPHSGVATARNLGVEQANGKYIMFCDSDDYAESDWIATLFEQIDKNPTSSVFCAFSKMNIVNKTDNAVALPDITESQYLPITEYYYIYINNMSSFLWNRIYRKDWIINNGLSFPLGLSQGEDLLFNIEYMKLCKDYFYNPKILYHWVDNNIQTLTRVYDPHYFDALKEFYYPRLSIIAKKDKQAFYDNSFYRFYTSMDHVMDKRNLESNRTKLKYCNYILRSAEFCDSVNHASDYNCSPKLKKLLKLKNYRLINFFLKFSRIHRKHKLRKETSSTETVLASKT